MAHWRSYSKACSCCQDLIANYTTGLGSLTVRFGRCIGDLGSLFDIQPRVPGGIQTALAGSPPLIDPSGAAV